MNKAVFRAKIQSQIPYLDGIKNIIAIGSGKGGVGKSTVSLHLAVELAQKGYQVGLLDADIYGPSLPTLTGIFEKATIVPGTTLLQPFDFQAVKCFSLGHLIGHNSAVAWRGPMASQALVQLFQNVAWGPLDFLLVDLPPGTGDLLLSLSQKVPVTAAILVSMDHPLSFADFQRAQDFFQKTQIHILGTVLNLCHSSDLKLTHWQKENLLAQIPFCTELLASTAHASPVQIYSPHSPSAQVLTQLADRFLSEFFQLPRETKISFQVKDQVQ